MKWFSIPIMIGGLLIGNSVFIHSKALIAQLLIQQAWADMQQRKEIVKPWPWADTWPVAKLFSPRLDLDLYVLEGSNGASLAFGPGRYRGLEATIIAGHRDTHFRFLQDVHIGDQLMMEDRQQRRRSYAVTSIDIMDTRTQTLPTPADNQSLLLVTCYPFDAVNPDGPLRYVVHAQLHNNTTLPKIKEIKA